MQIIGHSHPLIIHTRIAGDFSGSFKINGHTYSVKDGKLYDHNGNLSLSTFQRDMSLLLRPYRYRYVNIRDSFVYTGDKFITALEIGDKSITTLETGEIIQELDSESARPQRTRGIVPAPPESEDTLLISVGGKAITFEKPRGGLDHEIFADGGLLSIVSGLTEDDAPGEISCQGKIAQTSDGTEIEGVGLITGANSPFVGDLRIELSQLPSDGITFTLGTRKLTLYRDGRTTGNLDIKELYRKTKISRILLTNIKGVSWQFFDDHGLRSFDKLARTKTLKGIEVLARSGFSIEAIEIFLVEERWHLINNLSTEQLQSLGKLSAEEMHTLRSRYRHNGEDIEYIKVVSSLLTKGIPLQHIEWLYKIRGIEALANPDQNWEKIQTAGSKLKSLRSVELETIRALCEDLDIDELNSLLRLSSRNINRLKELNLMPDIGIDNFKLILSKMKSEEKVTIANIRDIKELSPDGIPLLDSVVTRFQPKERYI